MKIINLSSRDSNFTHVNGKLIWQVDFELLPNSRIALCSFQINSTNENTAQQVFCNLVDRDIYNPHGVIGIARKSFTAPTLSKCAHDESYIQ